MTGDNILSFWQEGPLTAYSVLFDNAPIKMHAVDQAGKLIDVSAFWADALGYSRQEMIGTHATDYLTEDSRKYANEVAFPKFFKEQRLEDVEYEFVRKDGSILPVLLSSVAQTDENDKFLHSLAVMFDISAMKHAQSLLEQKYRTEAIGSLVGGVAHDFNNILMVIRGNLEFLDDDFEDPMRETYLVDAMTAARRGAHLTRQLLSYGCKAQLRPKKIDLNRVIRDADSMLRRLVPKNISFETISFGGLWPSIVDRGNLETALLNLVNNAKDAMPDGGVITIETANVRVSDEFVAESGEDILPGRYCMLAVSDQGVGMPPEVQNRAFEPFFTSKATGQGSGLGLSMVHGFVKQSKGTIRLYSEVGFGTTVKIYFPAVDTSLGDPQYEADDMPDTTYLKSEVLVVEDKDDVRHLLVRQLSDRGLRIAEAGSGDLAWSLLQSGYRPKIIVTDVTMPGKIQGPALAKLARELIADVKMIFISGYPNEAAINGNDVGGNDVQLIKPVNRKELVTAVHNALDKS